MVTALLLVKREAAEVQRRMNLERFSGQTVLRSVCGGTNLVIHVI